MKIIIGLGNPGSRYSGTWHNLGFAALDGLAEKHGLSFKAGKGPYYAASGLIFSEKTVLVKPTTYMNLSGTAAASVLGYYGASAADIVAVYDDINIPLGTVRIRKSGSAGGHNGVKSLINSLGTEDFARLRIGFRTDHIASVLEKNPDILPDLVLAKIPSALFDDIRESLEKSVGAVECCLKDGIDRAMNMFNTAGSKNQPADQD